MEKTPPQENEGADSGGTRVEHQARWGERRYSGFNGMCSLFEGEREYEEVRDQTGGRIKIPFN